MNKKEAAETAKFIEEEEKKDMLDKMDTLPEDKDMGIDIKVNVKDDEPKDAE